MQINKSTRFALYAVVELAREAPAKLSVVEIANRYRISEHHMSKVMQILARNGVVEAVRGVGGGYQLVKSPKSLTVKDIVQILEPHFFARGCQLHTDDSACFRHHACAIHDLFDEVSQQVAATFSAVTVDRLAQQQEQLEIKA